MTGMNFDQCAFFSSKLFSLETLPFLDQEVINSTVDPKMSRSLLFCLTHNHLFNFYFIKLIPLTLFVGLLLHFLLRQGVFCFGKIFKMSL